MEPITTTTLAMLPLMAVLQLGIHEGAHYVTCKAVASQGSQVATASFDLFPGNGRIAHVDCGHRLTEDQRRVMLLAPRVADLAIIVGTEVAIRNIDNRFARSVLRAWQLAAAIDFGYNSLGILKQRLNSRDPKVNDAWGVVSPSTDTTAAQALTLATGAAVVGVTLAWTF